MFFTDGTNSVWVNRSGRTSWNTCCFDQPHRARYAYAYELSTTQDTEHCVSDVTQRCVPRSRCCVFVKKAHAQTTVEAACALHQTVSGRDGDEILSIALYTTRGAVRCIDKTGPLRCPADRDHCVQYIVAVCLLYGTLTAEHYTGAQHEQRQYPSRARRCQPTICVCARVQHLDILLTPFPVLPSQMPWRRILASMRCDGRLSCTNIRGTPRITSTRRGGRWRHRSKFILSIGHRRKK